MYANEIVIFCDSGSEKHGKKHPNPVVQGFHFREGEEDELGLGWTDINRSKRLIKNKAHIDAAQSLVGDNKPVRGIEFDGEHRESWNLRCLKCGFRVPIRHEKLYPALTKLRELGIQRISLRAIEDGISNLQ
ncbi:hypothetical protein [Glutamicibacter sp.]|uniref:hypothetical protein n=1 Tax=Glutamicibacter sp. TaxID=1931995 RepID=UPI002FDF565D